jgi:probable rRNA maturation factor
MSYAIDVQDDAGYGVDVESLIRAATTVLDRHEVDRASALSIVFLTDEEMAGYNRRFRGVDAPTDVLSFPADAPPVEIPEEAPYLGDLIIAFPYASAQATRERHALQDSLSLLVIHGTLHLLGYDHDTAERRAEMWAAQDEALRTLGIPTDIVPSLERLPKHDDEQE